jgi:hypothetical protein
MYSISSRRRRRRQPVIRKQRRSTSHNFVRESPVWPLPELEGRRPVIISAPSEDHIDLAYERATGPYVPARTPVFAVKSGVIIGVTQSDAGRSITIDHRNGFMTSYDGLADTIVRPVGWCRRRVERGEIIGYLAASACTAIPVRALRVTVSRVLSRGVPGFPMQINAADTLAGSAFVQLGAVSGGPASEAGAAKSHEQISVRVRDAVLVAVGEQGGNP